MSFLATIAMVRTTLKDVFHQVDAWFDRPAEMRQFKPVSGGWTVDQVLEHITMTNHFLMLTLRKWVEIALRRAQRGEAIKPGESDLKRVDIIGQRGSFAWVRPAHMEPTNRVASDVVRDTMKRQVAECLAMLERISHGEGSLCRIRMTVNDLGKIDLYQWLYFLGQHARRHLQQMIAIETEFAERSARP